MTSAEIFLVSDSETQSGPEMAKLVGISPDIPSKQALGVI